MTPLEIAVLIVLFPFALCFPVVIIYDYFQRRKESAEMLRRALDESDDDPEWEGW